MCFFVNTNPHLLTPGLSATSTLRAVTKFEMPAMSPTMTEGGIASWKKREGDSFTAGDVLLEIETDKAVIDVEAQDDGIVGKILAQDGQKNIPVGKVIALLAEEGDDISNLEIPKDEPTPSKSVPVPKQEQAPPTPSSPAPPVTPKATHHISHSRPLFPSVSRLLQEYGVQDPEKIKGTGVRGMLTKGDVLAFLGKASSPTGTFKPTLLGPGAEGSQKGGGQGREGTPRSTVPLDGLAIRQLIVQSMYQTALKARAGTIPPILASFDSVIADYLPPLTTRAASTLPPVLPSKPKSSDFLDGLI
ncbi:single hybrid motif-containing protein [Lactarius indigo]|nr:single hybrid motif-containing protein [Lactarius indigo]